MTKARILIVEDQFIEANNLRMILHQAGYPVCTIARSVPGALKIIEKENPDLVLLDIQLQGSLSGIDLAETLRKQNIAFVYLSANSDKQILETAVATKPYGFLVKPFREKDVLVMLDVAWYRHRENLESTLKKSAAPGNQQLPPPLAVLDNIVGENPGMLKVMKLINIVSPADTSVLITGESGTGKELIAKGIHRLSARNKKPLVVVNCAALPANLIESELFGHERGAFTGAMEKRTGKFELANEGTIFLDEIGELTLDLQVKFLRVLQEKEIEPIGGITKKVDVRVIAATNRNLIEEIAAGRFRMDLYYRLNVFPIVMPTLRERKEDILLLATHFIRKYATLTGAPVTGLSDSVLKQMLSYSWPGNVRELENLMERSVLLANGPIIDQLLLPHEEKKEPLNEPTHRIKTINENERDHILAALESCNWKIYGQGGAAELLDINVSTLNSRIKKLGIQKKINFKSD